MLAMRMQRSKNALGDARETEIEEDDPAPVEIAPAASAHGLKTQYHALVYTFHNNNLKPKGKTEIR